MLAKKRTWTFSTSGERKHWVSSPHLLGGFLSLLCSGCSFLQLKIAVSWYQLRRCVYFPASAPSSVLKRGSVVAVELHMSPRLTRKKPRWCGELRGAWTPLKRVSYKMNTRQKLLYLRKGASQSAAMWCSTTVNTEEIISEWKIWNPIPEELCSRSSHNFQLAVCQWLNSTRDRKCTEW